MYYCLQLHCPQGGELCSFISQRGHLLKGAKGPSRPRLGAFPLGHIIERLGSSVGGHEGESPRAWLSSGRLPGYCCELWSVQLT